jgi:hypothetical protein
VGSWTVTRRGLLLAAAGSGLLAAWPAPARAAAGPEIVDCAGWGARPNSRVVNVVAQRPVKILVHHTATPNADDLGRAAADRLARGIQDFHMDRRGWLDSGQHFTISRGGFVLEGRHRSLEALRSGRKQVEAAHCTGQNLVSIGIENEGTYTDTEPTGPLWDRLRELCAYTCAQYGIAPTEIFGHRDFKDTLCPGDVLYGMLPRLRSEVAGLLGKRPEGASVHAASWPLLRMPRSGPAVRAAQHLLRAAGHPEVPTDGTFGRATESAVRRFQTERGTEEVNGLVGGESWPLLVAQPENADGDVAAALAAVSPRGAEGTATPTEQTWKRLLTDAAGP